MKSRNQTQGKFQGRISGGKVVRGFFPIEGYAPAYPNRRARKAAARVYKGYESWFRANNI